MGSRTQSIEKKRLFIYDDEHNSIFTIIYLIMINNNLSAITFNCLIFVDNLHIQSKHRTGVLDQSAEERKR